MTYNIDKYIKNRIKRENDWECKKVLTLKKR